jgi:hypothetical protein
MKQNEERIPYTRDIAELLNEALASFKAVGRGAVVYIAGPPEENLYVPRLALFEYVQEQGLSATWIDELRGLVERYKPKWEVVFIVKEGAYFTAQIVKRPGAVNTN